MKKIVDMDLCAAGLPIPYDECPHCGATADQNCRLLDEFSPKEVRENRRRAQVGESVNI